MELPVSSNLMGDLRKMKESEDSKEFHRHLPDMKVKLEHVSKVEGDKEEGMSTHESEESQSEDGEPVHPYANLIESFEYKKEQLEVCNVEPMKTLDDTDFEIIRTQEELMKIIGELRSQKEISLVVQDYKMELLVVAIGTFEKQYIIDAVKLNNSLDALTEIFINAEIIKVVYDMEYVKLHLLKQHLYLVNVFDIKPAYFYKEREEVSFYDLLSRKYVMKKKIRVRLNKILKGAMYSKHVRHFRVRAHYLLYLYHDIKNYLLLNDEEGYMNLLEKMQKESLSLKCDISRKEYLHPIKTQFIQHHQCELEVLEKLDDWRVAKFGPGFDSIESGLPKDDVIAIAKEIPWSISELDELLLVTLTLNDKNAILDIVKQSRISKTLGRFAYKKRKRKCPASIDLPCTQQTSNASKKQQNIEIIPKNLNPTNMSNEQFSGSSTNDLQNRNETNNKRNLNEEATTSAKRKRKKKRSVL